MWCHYYGPAWCRLHTIKSFSNINSSHTFTLLFEHVLSITNVNSRLWTLSCGPFISFKGSSKSADIHMHYFAAMIRLLHLWPEPQITQRLARDPWNPRDHDTDTCLPKQIMWRHYDFPQWFPNPLFLLWSLFSVSLFNCVYSKATCTVTLGHSCAHGQHGICTSGSLGQPGLGAFRWNGSLRANDFEQIRLIPSKRFARDTRVRAKRWGIGSPYPLLVPWWNKCSHCVWGRMKLVIPVAFYFFPPPNSPFGGPSTGGKKKSPF